MYELTVEGKFDSGHWIRGYPGPCANQHGHTFYYQAQISAKELNELGMLEDFKVVKEAMKSIIEEYLDHSVINSLPPFTTINPTAENLAKWIYDNLKGAIPGLDAITVWESPECSATYYE